MNEPLVGKIYAYRPNGQPVSIHDAPSGLALEAYSEPSGGYRLVAKKGTKVRHHWARYVPGQNSGSSKPRNPSGKPARMHRFIERVLMQRYQGYLMASTAYPDSQYQADLGSRIVDGQTIFTEVVVTSAPDRDKAHYIQHKLMDPNVVVEYIDFHGKSARITCRILERKYGDIEGDLPPEILDEVMAVIERHTIPKYPTAWESSQEIVSHERHHLDHGWQRIKIEKDSQLAWVI